MAHEQHLKSVPSPHPSPHRGEGKGEGDVSFLSFLQKQESRFFCVAPFLQEQVWIPAFAGMTTLACFDKIRHLVLLRINKRQRKEEVWPLSK